MTESKICTCPSGDGSLRWPCPAHPADQAGGDERAAFERAFTVQEGIYFDDKRGEYRSMNLRAIEATDAQDLNLRLQGWQARAALAQPSPAQAEQAEVKRLREENANLILTCASLDSEKREMQHKWDAIIAERDAALARVAELETALEPFAAVADAYDDSEDDDHEPYTDMGCDDRLRLTLGQHRAGRIALEGRTPQAQAQHSVPEGLALIPVRETEAMHDAVMALLYKGVARTDTQKLLDAYIAAAPGKEVGHE
ncbi:TPA: hypothetical protein SMT80_000177 [Pseudomonas aeruginosa]|nr:hypothetical protein [Pseudomonas aeruginosa]